MSSQAFFDHIIKQHPDPENFSAFIAACQRPPRKSIRVNTLKITVDDFKKIALKRGWILENIPWCKEGFWISHTDPQTQTRLGNSGEHLLGLFYIQEASSMLPAVALLDSKPANLVLDMAAAPGSKTTQLAAMMANKGTILANELSASRIKTLHANLQRCGVNNTCLSHFDGAGLDKNLAGYFDAVLLDAPCGGEGTCRKDPDALNNWSLDSLEILSSVQKQLLCAAWKMLKPAGRLVYSTCTLSRQENQQVIAYLQHTFPNEINIIKLDTLFDGAKKVTTREGFLSVWPEIFDCEGFFVACLEKKLSVTSDIPEPVLLSTQSPFKTLDEKTSLLVQQYYQNHFGFDLSDLKVRLKIRSSQQQQIWLFPEAGSKLRQVLRVQRSGIRICDLINSRNGPLLKTNNEFVSNFGGKFTRQTVQLNAAEAKACCNGNNIIVEDAEILEKGEVVMCYQGHALGIAKVLPVKLKTIKLKNNLPRDLLRNNADFQS